MIAVKPSWLSSYCGGDHPCRRSPLSRPCPPVPTSPVAGRRSRCPWCQVWVGAGSSSVASSRMRSADERRAVVAIGACQLSCDTTDRLNSGAVIADNRTFCLARKPPRPREIWFEPKISSLPGSCLNGVCLRLNLKSDSKSARWNLQAPIPAIIRIGAAARGKITYGVNCSFAAITPLGRSLDSADQGVLACLDGKSGTEHYRQRLGGAYNA
jgi:hypothetical protein